MPRVSKRPYLLRALFDWMVASGLTPHLAVDASVDGVQVPVEFVESGRIVLNVSANAVRNFVLGDEWVTFDGRFGGVARQIRVPMAACVAIYARENGEGMLFEPEAPATPPVSAPGPDDPRTSHLKVVK